MGPERRAYDARAQELAWRLYLLDREERRCPASCEPGAGGATPTPTTSPRFQL